jgi:hypothetical protein
MTFRKSNTNVASKQGERQRKHNNRWFGAAGLFLVDSTDVV